MSASDAVAGRNALLTPSVYPDAGHPIHRRWGLRACRSRDPATSVR
jgi:hypothetical protein